MILSLLLAAATPFAPPSAIWAVEGQPGSIRSVIGTIRTGGRIVADDLVSDPASLEEEKVRIIRGKPPQGSCELAGSVRSFKRLRRFAADGRLLWQWVAGRKADGTVDIEAENQAFRLLAPAHGDCLSPDGGRLLMSVYSTEIERPVLMIDGVAAVDRRPRFVEAVGKRTGESFGPKGQTAPQGWRRGGDATLLFVFTQHDPEKKDYAVLGRRP